LRYFVEDDPLQALVERAVDHIFDSGENIYFTPQVARESWAVLTRPKNVGGYAQTSSEASKFIEEAGLAFAFIPDVPDIYTRWIEIVKIHDVAGRQVHDAYHVAAMMTHGLTQILTLDERDFRRYPEITVANPATM